LRPHQTQLTDDEALMLALAAAEAALARYWHPVLGRPKKPWRRWAEFWTMMSWFRLLTEKCALTHRRTLPTYPRHPAGPPAQRLAWPTSANCFETEKKTPH
jgi:hypothetical protein